MPDSDDGGRSPVDYLDPEDSGDEEDRVPGVADFVDEDDRVLVDFLEAEMLSVPDLDEKPAKKPRTEEGSSKTPSRIESGIFGNVPPELFHHILKFLSPEDLTSCCLVCWFLNSAAADERLWRRLYCLRWGIASPTGKPRKCAWKKLYIQRDQDDLVEFVSNTTEEFKEYYIQMQVAKRSQAPLPSQVSDDRFILDKTVGDQVSSWKRNRGFTDEAVMDHVCTGSTCSYTQIGDVFLCEKTGQVHVCDETCREVVVDDDSGLLVCRVSGQCFDRLLAPQEDSDTEQQQAEAGAPDEAVEPSMGSGRFARAYLLGYNCADEKELEHALKFC